ncbi:MAG: glycosyltransferase family 87 protein [Phycisphaerales bacterium]
MTATESSPSNQPSPWWASAGVRAAGYAGSLAIVLLGTNASYRIMTGGEPLARRYRDFYEFFSGAEALVKGTDVFAAGDLGYIYPPLLATLMMPLVKLGLEGAGLVWLVINAFMLAFTAWLGGWTVASRLGVPKAAPLVTFIGLALLADKLFGDMKMQQSNILMLTCWTIGMWGLGRHWLISGLALGFGFNIKYLPVVALPYFGVRGRLKHAIGLAVGIVFWALIPAVFIGWQSNADLWRGATSGLIHSGDAESKTEEGRARVMNTREYGISITTAVVRTADSIEQPKLGLPVAALLMLGVFGAAWWIYHRNQQPMWLGRWGAAEESRWPVLLVEWTGLIVVTLAFSPQTNSRHLVHAMPLGFLIGAMIVSGKSTNTCRLAIAAAAIWWLGMVLPPSIPSIESMEKAVWMWRRASGSCICMIIAWLITAEAVLRNRRQTPSGELG